MKSSWLGRVVAASLVLFFSAVPSRAAPMTATEYEVKAAFLYNFAKFVDWPSTSFQNPNEPIVLGLIGEDPFGGSIDAMLSGITVQRHPLVLKRIKDPKTDRCHILFIASSEKGRLQRILSALDEKPVLTVSDIPNFIDHGGMIGFEMTDDKVRFSINKSAADAAHLQFSSQVLKLATTVKQTPGAKGE